MLAADEGGGRSSDVTSAGGVAPGQPSSIFTTIISIVDGVVHQQARSRINEPMMRSMLGRDIWSASAARRYVPSAMLTKHATMTASSLPTEEPRRRWSVTCSDLPAALGVDRAEFR